MKMTKRLKPWFQVSDGGIDFAKYQNWSTIKQMEAAGRTPRLRDLIRIVNEEPNDSIRIVAIRRIPDQKFLRGVADNYRNSVKVRKAAVEGITDQNDLADIAITPVDYGENDEDASIRPLELRAAAFVRIKDQNALMRVIHECKRDDASNPVMRNDEHIRALAAGRLRDQNELSNLALTDPSEAVRHAALVNLNVMKVLDRVKADDSSPKVRRLADLRLEYVKKTAAAEATGKTPKTMAAAPKEVAQAAGASDGKDGAGKEGATLELNPGPSLEPEGSGAPAAS